MVACASHEHGEGHGLFLCLVEQCVCLCDVAFPNVKGDRLSGEGVHVLAETCDTIIICDMALVADIQDHFFYFSFCDMTLFT